MKIRKFDARTEQEAISMVKEELGPKALVVNIKSVKPRGLSAIFKKPYVEITAAYDEENEKNAIQGQAAEPGGGKEGQGDKPDPARFEAAMREVKLQRQEDTIKLLEMKLNTTEDMLRRTQERLMVSSYMENEGERRYNNNIIQIFYDALVNAGVLPDYAAEILDEMENLDDSENIDINLLVKVVYNTIRNVIGSGNPIPTQPPAVGQPRIYAFMGATGVGKTTTIAKLSAEFILNHDFSVGLITSDTYRIAAVEQLKTYGDILGTDVSVVYSPDDMESYIKALSVTSDIIFIDTAGRSPKNTENLTELSQLLEKAPGCEKFLVLSLTTKHEDLISTIEAFSLLGDFSILFTKLDETGSLGGVFNVCRQTGKKVSYVTFGQNVPDDIKSLQPEEIAKGLLGLGDAYGSGK